MKAAKDPGEEYYDPMRALWKMKAAKDAGEVILRSSA